MFDYILEALDGVPVETIYVMVIMVIMRPLGFLYSFVLFSWAFGSGITLRLGVSLIFGLVVLFYDAVPLRELTTNMNIGGRLVILSLEYGIGYGLGILASAPFTALKYAGEIADSYRGENNSGFKDPTGGELTTFSTLYFVVGSVVFVQSEGIFIAIDSLYKTYVLFPIGFVDFNFDVDWWWIIVELIERSLILGMIIAAPLLIIYLAIDFLLIVALKVAPRFAIFEYAFLFRNLAAIISLPTFVYYILRISERSTGYVQDVVAIFLGVFP